jgi:hypothetical protein
MITKKYMNVRFEVPILMTMVKVKVKVKGRLCHEEVCRVEV